MGRVALLVAALLVLALAFSPRAAAFVYWTNNSGTTIGRADLDGTGVDQSFIGGASNPCGVAVDPAHLYWANNVPSGTIGRADLDGTGANQSFITGASIPCGVAVDAAHLYWANLDDGRSGAPTSTARGWTKASSPAPTSLRSGGRRSAPLLGQRRRRTIGRADLDGTGVDQNFVGGAILPCGAAVDAAHLYWADGLSDTIGRAGLDGTGADQAFIDGANSPCGVALDGAHLYWANGGDDTIGRAGLDGTGVNQGFIAGASGPCGVAVDALTPMTSPPPASPPPPPLPSNEFTLGKPKLNEKKGTARLPATVPGPGERPSPATA